MRVGVLALQGDVREHIAIFDSLGVFAQEVRKADQLSGLSGLVIPGGESTTISKLIDVFGLREPILDYANSGGGIYGTCAGMIMLAKDVIDSAAGQRSLGLLDISVRRNAFGSQLDSFETRLRFAGFDANVAFIRAPLVERVGENVEILARLDSGEIVAVREGKHLATAFHPEITGEKQVHEYFLGMLQ